MKLLSFELIDQPKRVMLQKDGVSVYQATAESNDGHFFLVTWKSADSDEIFLDAPYKIELIKGGIKNGKRGWIIFL